MNLNDLVRGIRNNKDDEAKYIAQCLEEIKTELRQQNTAVKTNAVAKLNYLQMLGYDISWAQFNIIEVMSSSKFSFAFDTRGEVTCCRERQCGFSGSDRRQAR